MHFARQNKELNHDEIVQCFKEYTHFSTGKKPPSQKEFLINLEEKEIDLDFIGDMEALLRPDVEYNQEAAMKWLKDELIERI